MPASTLELWQTEWCPASHRVRQRLTELGLSYLVRQVPVEREDRAELISATGHKSIPVLVADGEVVAGENMIVTYLNTRFAEPREAERQRVKAAKVRNEDLEKARPRAPLGGSAGAALPGSARAALRGSAGVAHRGAARIRRCY